MNKIASETERTLPVVSAAFDERGAGVESTMAGKILKKEKTPEEDNSLDSIANL